MPSMTFHPLILILTAAVVGLPLINSHAEQRVLLKDDATLLTARHSMMGPRESTLLFYTFAEQKVVMRLQIGHADGSFTATGNVFIFDPSTSEENLANWINNQHSDALYRGVPDPVLTVELAEGTCTITEHELLDEKPRPPMNHRFKDYRLTLEVKSQRIGDLFELREFKETVRLFVKSDQP